ncbi:MAG: sensor histidine kinase, partial [Coriobacteriia bacterium]|nr:sensor histidine kinase [Coriobacteriia bacterium]
EKDLDPELSAKYAAISYDKAKQLEALIEALFDTAHLTMDDLQINREQLDLEQLLLQKREELYPQLHDAEMTVRMKIEAPTINADGALMARVFDNLFNNAIRYTREGRSIDIIGVPIPDGVRITLATHANPIPAEDLERVFDKLYRLDKSRGSGDRGTGLGLPISRKIIELHGGQLTARQTSDGTAFDIYLPN